MKAKELIETLSNILDEEDVTNSQFATCDYPDSLNDRITEELGEFEDLDGQLLDVDEGWRIYQYVFHFKKYDIYIGITDLYHSWADSEDGEIYEVKPVVKTVYEAVEDEEDVG